MNAKMCDLYYDNEYDVFWLRLGNKFIPIVVALWTKPQVSEMYTEFMKKVAKNFHE